MVYEISQPKRGPCEIKAWLRKGPFTAKSFRSLIATLYKNFRSCETPLWHTSAISQPLSPFRSCENALRNLQSLKNSNFAAITPFRSYKTTPWHTSAISQPYPLILQLRNRLQNSLRKHPSTTKLTICCENASLLRKLQPSLGLHF